MFRDRVEYVKSCLDEDELPSERVMQTWLYDCLKGLPKLAIRIEKLREAQIGSSIRFHGWPRQSMLDAIGESPHDLNTASILATFKAKVDHPVHETDVEKKIAKEKEKREKKDKDFKAQATASVNAAAAAAASAAKAKAKAKRLSRSQQKAEGSREGKGSNAEQEIQPREEGMPCLLYPSGKSVEGIHALTSMMPRVTPKGAAAKPKTPGVAAVAAVFCNNGIWPTASSIAIPRFAKAFMSASLSGHWNAFHNRGLPSRQMSSVLSASQRLPDRRSDFFALRSRDARLLG